MDALERELDAIASEAAFSGVVRVDRGDKIVVAKAFGLAHRGYAIPNEIDTRLAIASGTKGLTALTIVSLVEDGLLELSTTARSLLGKDLPLIGDDVTVEHLLAHRSGIGDYLDEESDLDVDDYLMPVPVHELGTTEQYVAILDGHPPKFAPGERFSHSNSGYVVLALIAERAASCSTSSCVGVSASRPAWAIRSSCARTSAGPHRTRLPRNRRRVENERVPSAGARQRRRRDLLHGGGLSGTLDSILRGQDRAAELGRGDGSPPQRRA